MADKPDGKPAANAEGLMTGHRGRDVFSAEKAALLGRIRELRTTCAGALAARPVGGRDYRVAEAAMAAMDDLAERLTGEPRPAAPVLAS
ncbi:MAG: hypothetical protein J0H01_06775 [Rhizobiales bacterium]|nr:hypothetical protein [Hyphomicrobiales bacterium]